MGRSQTKYVVNPDSGQERSPLSFLSSTVLILTSFSLYLLDQGTDALTALLYFLDVSNSGSLFTLSESMLSLLSNSILL